MITILLGLTISTAYGQLSKFAPEDPLKGAHSGQRYRVGLVTAVSGTSITLWTGWRPPQRFGAYGQFSAKSYDPSLGSVYNYGLNDIRSGDIVEICVLVAHDGTEGPCIGVSARRRPNGRVPPARMATGFVGVVGQMWHDRMNAHQDHELFGKPLPAWMTPPPIRFSYTPEGDIFWLQPGTPVPPPAPPK